MSGDAFRLAADWLPDDIADPMLTEAQHLRALADAAIVYVNTDHHRRGRAFAALEQAVRTYQEETR
jgi:hypothetical protein